MPRAKNPQLKLWRKRMKRFNLLKPKIVAFLQSTGWDKEQINTWLKTPRPELRNRSPKQCINPTSIQVLYKFIDKYYHF